MGERADEDVPRMWLRRQRDSGRRLAQMKRAGVDLAEQIKWWDIMDDLLDNVQGSEYPAKVETALRRARECRHPDARWLASLGCSTRAELEQAVVAQTDDPRALVFVAVCKNVGPAEQHERLRLLERAAEMGDARAQVQMSLLKRMRGEGLRFAEMAAAQGERAGLRILAHHKRYGEECAQDLPAAIELFRRASELGCPRSQVSYGDLAYGPEDWQRLCWWGRASRRGWCSAALLRTALGLLPRFERGGLARALFVAGPAVRALADTMLGRLAQYEPERAQQQDRLLSLCDELMERARRAIRCWSLVGLRCGVVKDMRVMVAKMLWEEAWRWGEKGSR
jgi:hypothetical protein